MAFLRGFWHFLVGLKDALALLFLLLFFLALWSLLQTRAPLQVPGGSALLLDLDGFIVDQATQRSPFELLAGGVEITPEIEARTVVEAIERAREDARISAIALQLDNFYGAGQANLQAIGAALQSFRAAGKPVHAYGTAFLDDGYYLAAHADRIWLNPLGGVMLTGPGGSNLYFDEALDKLKINVNVFRVGTYKAAVEPFTRDEASPEARVAQQALVDTLWRSYVADVQRVRPTVDVSAFIRNLPQQVAATGGDLARTAKESGLVDQIGTYTDFGLMMRERVGAPARDDGPGGFNQIDFRDYMAATRPLTRTSGPAVGVVYVAGEIIDGEAPPGTAGGDTIAKLIEERLADDDIKALVVRVDSPGGSVLASEKIRQALATAKAEGLPVVASLGPVAASGGYWVATAADEIYAQPSTITGSIGVFAILPTFERTLDELGINADAIKSTPYSGEPDVLNGLSPETGTLIQATVEDIYRRFVGLVSAARNLPVETVDEIAQGRVWAGTTAHELRLVDHMGSLDAAIAAARRRAGLPDNARVIDIEVAPPFPFQLIEQLMGPGRQEEQARDPFARLARTSQLRLTALLSEALRLSSGTAATMQARCLSCSLYQPRQPVLPSSLLGKGLLPPR